MVPGGYRRATLFVRGVRQQKLPHPTTCLGAVGMVAMGSSRGRRRSGLGESRVWQALYVTPG